MGLDVISGFSASDPKPFLIQIW